MKVISALNRCTCRSLGPQYVEFSGFEVEDGENDSLQLPDPNAQKANQQQAKSLEALLSVKNKKLLEELTRFRVSSTHIYETAGSLNLPPVSPVRYCTPNWKPRSVQYPKI